MAEENKLEIILTLIDKASKELQEVMDKAKKGSSEVEKQGKKTEESFKKLNSELRSFKREALLAVGVITTMYLSIKEYAKYNIDAANSVNQLEKEISKLKVAVGGFLFEFTKAYKADFFKGLAGPLPAIIAAFNAMRKSGSDFQETMGRANELIEAKNRLEAYKKSMQELDLLFLTGKINAEQYYSIISGDNVASGQNITTQMQLMQQMASQENMMRNKSLMDYQADVNAKMSLLNTLKEYHHTAYSAMFNFINMGIQKFSTGFTTALTSIIMGTKKASEAFKEFGLQMITSIVEFVIQYGIQMLIAAALSKVIMASTIGQAGAIAAAWLPAATFASIATLGAAGAAGAAGMASGTATGMGIGAAAIAAAKGLGAGMGTGPSGGGGWAEGGWVGLNGPQLGWVGERGPEYIVPNDKLGKMGNQTSINIEINYPTVRSDEDIDRLTEEISLRLARESERL